MRALRLSAFVCVVSAAANAGAQGTDRLGPEVEAALAWYGTVASVHIDADVDITRGGMTGAGLFQYWAEGNKYRINCATPSKRLGIFGDVQYAFDGLEFQFLYPDAEVLSIQPHADVALPTAVPNPFFLPVDYLSRDDDACPACQLSLTALASHPEARPTRTRRGVLLKVRTTAKTIEWLRADGTVATSISFDRSIGADFPRRIVLRDLSADGQLQAEVEYRLRVVDLNTRIDPSVFEIPRNSAARVVRE